MNCQETRANVNEPGLIVCNGLTSVIIAL